MAKIIKEGIFSLENGFPKSPPANLKVVCCFCETILEIVENEKVKFDKQLNRGVWFIGWSLKCPQCGRKIFIPHLGISNKELGKLNGYYK